MKFIHNFLIFESVSQAKSILKSIDKDTDDWAYKMIRNLLSGHDGYVGWFTKLHYKFGYSIHHLKDLWDLIKGNPDYISKLPNQLLSYENIEKIQDDLEKVKIQSLYNRILNEFPVTQRSFLRESDRDLLINLSKRRDNKSFFKKVSSYKSRTALITGIKTFLSVNPDDGFDKVLKKVEDAKAKIIHESYEDNILIVRVFDVDQLNYLAGDCSWCIRSESTFKSYVGKFSKQFIVFLFDKIDSYSKIGITSSLNFSKFFHTAHDKNDNYISYDRLSDLLSKYSVELDDILRFELGDLNVDDIPVKKLINDFQLTKEEAVKLKNRLTPEDISLFTKEEIEKWNILEKTEISIKELEKLSWDEIEKGNLLKRLNVISILDINRMYKKWGYRVIKYIKNNSKILESLPNESWRGQRSDLEFYKNYIKYSNSPKYLNDLEVGGRFSSLNPYDYEQTFFRILWFVDDIKKLIKTPRDIKYILKLDSSTGDEAKLLKNEFGIDLEDIKNVLIEEITFDFDIYLNVIKLFKEEGEDPSEIINFTFDNIKKYSIKDYEMENYKKSGIFSDSQIEELKSIKSYREFLKDIPSNPYSRNMTKSYSEEFYKKWSKKLKEYIPRIPEDFIKSIILVYTKLGKLSELKKVEKFEFNSEWHGKRLMSDLSDIVSGLYRTNGGMYEDLSEQECKNLYEFFSSQIKIKIKDYEGNLEYSYLESMYLYDRNRFENLLVYDLSNIKLNYDKGSSKVTNRIYPVTDMFEFFFRSKKKPGGDELIDFINTLLSFSLSLLEITHIIEILMRYSDVDSEVKKMLLTTLNNKTRNQKILSKYLGFLNR